MTQNNTIIYMYFIVDLFLNFHFKSIQSKVNIVYKTPQPFMNTKKPESRLPRQIFFMNRIKI